MFLITILMTTTQRKNLLSEEVRRPIEYSERVCWVRLVKQGLLNTPSYDTNLRRHFSEELFLEPKLECLPIETF